MGRMHAPGKGISRRALPYKRTPPSWLKVSAADVEDQVCKLAKKGLMPSQIGVILRDSHGIAQVKSVTGQKVVRILKAAGLAPEIPEDLYQLIKKAVAVRKHLERNRQDKDAKFRLILIESRIHRLARYYRKLPFFGYCMRWLFFAIPFCLTQANFFVLFSKSRLFILSYRVSLQVYRASSLLTGSMSLPRPPRWSRKSYLLKLSISNLY
jgi:small subunit ribosomal protein S13e